DTGEGVPKEALPKLFTKFFRVSGRLEQGSKGTGLGLYITKEIINLHKGDISVESELGKGTTITFSLPIASESDIKKYSQVSEAAESSNKGFIINTKRVQSKQLDT
ncbi:MAG TPA: ATP-binding protein, partial [Xanthomonadales bacterium]|nr:ATP-binding protein [Xanthomonadales bacterium]